MPQQSTNDDTTSPQKTLELDLTALRERLGPRKVALIDQWIREVNGPLDALIAHHVTSDTILLDAGCSRGDPDLPALNHAHRIVGVDVDLPGLRANNIAHACVMAPMGRFPFADESFDLIVSKWVAEHLEHPEADFRECNRILKHGGHLILLTPNAYSLFTTLSRLIPYRLKQIFKGNLFGVHEEDTFRTWYRANTPATLNKLMHESGFKCANIHRLPGMWTFFIFNTPIAKAVRWLEHLQLQIPLLKHATTYLLGAWEKEAAPAQTKDRACANTQGAA